MINLLLLTRPLDIIRVKTLRYSMYSHVLRRIFTDRCIRNNVTIGFSIFINLILMLFYPLWTLMVVPSMLGMFHLIASLSAFHGIAAPSSYQENEHCKKTIQRSLFFFCFCFFLARMLTIFSQALGFDWLAITFATNLRLIDGFIVAGAFLFISLVYQQNLLKFILSSIIFFSAITLILAGPSIVWGIFIFSHNVMAFVFWFSYAPTKKEKISAIISAFLCVLIHIMVLLPIGDVFFLHPINQQPTALFGYDFISISMELLPENFDVAWARKIVSLLCFGQGIHYILWIRIIPDCRLKKQATLPFRTRLKAFQKDVGNSLAIILVALSIIFLVAPLFYNYNTINDVFFALAFFHIYAEFMAFLFATTDKLFSKY